MLRPLASPSRPRRLEVVHPGVAGDLLAERRRLLVGGGTWKPARMRASISSLIASEKRLK